MLIAASIQKIPKPCYQPWHNPRPSVT